jgi:preprotein translocase subunit SecB
MEDSKFPVRDDFIAKYDVKVVFKSDVKSEKSRKLKVFFEIDNFGIFSVSEIIAVQE